MIGDGSSIAALMPSAHHDQRIFDRARRIALEEQTAFLKSLKAMPPEFRDRLAGVTIRFEERPSKEMVEGAFPPRC